MCDFFFFEFFLSLFSLLSFESWHLQSILKEERGEKDPPFWTKKNEIVIKKNKRATNACVCSFLRKDEEEEEEEDKRVTSFDVSFQHQ